MRHTAKQYWMTEKKCSGSFSPLLLRVSKLMPGIISMHVAIGKLYLLGNGRFHLVNDNTDKMGKAHET